MQLTDRSKGKRRKTIVGALVCSFVGIGLGVVGSSEAQALQGCFGITNVGTPGSPSYVSYQQAKTSCEVNGLSAAKQRAIAVCQGSGTVYGPITTGYASSVTSNCYGYVAAVQMDCYNSSGSFFARINPNSAPYGC